MALVTLALELPKVRFLLSVNEIGCEREQTKEGCGVGQLHYDFRSVAIVYYGLISSKE
jgi:hypothetical protein